MRVLFLSYYFPPSPTPAAERISGWTKYLNAEGVECTVITRAWGNDIRTINDALKETAGELLSQDMNSTGAKVIITPHIPTKRDTLILSGQRRTLLRKVLTFRQILGEFFAPKTSPKYNLFSAAENELNSSKYDLIVATGEPFVLFKYASKLSRTFNIPWVADFRDAWANNPTGNYKPFIKRLYSYLEKKYCKTASAQITVSEPYCSRLMLFNKRPTYVIENSFDPELEVLSSKQKEFTVTFAGSIYDSEYVDILAKGIESIHDWSNFDVHFKFVGIDLYKNNGTKKVHDLQLKYPDNISITPRVPQNKFLEEIHSAHVLLGLIPGSQSYGIIAAKTYQYLSTENPIIMLESVKPTKLTPIDPSITYVYSAEELSSSIRDLYEKWRDGASIITSRSNRVSRHSHIVRAKQLIKIFEKIT